MTPTKLWTALSLILAVLVCCGATQAQQNKSGSENVKADDAALRAKAFDLLESLASQISTLQSAENRARLGSNIAGSLWDHNEKRARSLLVSVEAEIKAELQKTDEDEQTEAQTRTIFLKLRMDTVERIAKHDVELALAFLKATELRADKPQPYEVTEMERSVELRLAKQVAAENPDVALKLGRQSLARGFPNDLLSLLKQLNKKHREQSLILYKEIVAKLREADLGLNSEASYFAGSLAHSLKPPAADEATYRELISLLITTALENGCGKEIGDDDERAAFCDQIGSLLPLIEKIDPLRAAQLKHWAPESPWESTPEGLDELNDLNENGTVDEVLALAQKYPDIKNQVYWIAFSKAEASGDIERARKIATDHIEDPGLRRSAIEQLDSAQAWASMNAEKVAEVQREIGQVPRIRDRIWILMAVASQVAANDRQAALKLLNQSGGLIGTMKTGREQTEAEVRLAMMYCLVKSDRGLAMMELLMPKLNDLVTAAAKLDGYETHYLRDGEWNMTGAGSVGKLLTMLSQNAAYFSWCDFDRAVSLAAQFERPELRFMAQLKLAQGVLAGPPKRSILMLFSDRAF